MSVIKAFTGDLLNRKTKEGVIIEASNYIGHILS